MSVTEVETPEVFVGRSTGTRIIVSLLNESWTRGMVRGASRAVTALRSPFEQEEEFKAHLTIEPETTWLNGLLSADEVLEYSLFQASGTISNSSLEYTYEFTPYSTMKKVERRRVTRVLDLPPMRSKDNGVAPELYLSEVGNVRFEIRLFDRERLSWHWAFRTEGALETS